MRAEKSRLRPNFTSLQELMRQINLAIRDQVGEIDAFLPGYYG